jgi:beta-glucan synthesis-associated protein KRE6
MKILKATGALACVCCSIEASWIDPDTPTNAAKVSSLVDGRTFELVFSDEFEVTGRIFDDGHDPRWTALHKNDYTNNALQ